MQMDAKKRKKIIDRFFNRIEMITESGCWVWMGASSLGGYGRLRTGKENASMAHKVSWELLRGEIPDGMQVLHKCDIPACVNPNHLFLGTQLENVRDCQNKGRFKDNRGEKNGRSKLTEKQVLEVRNDSRFARVIASDYGISLTTVDRVKHGRNWSHVCENNGQKEGIRTYV